VGARADPAVIGVQVYVAAAHDGDDAPTGEAVAVFENRRDASRGRRLDNQASMAGVHPHPGDDRRLGDHDGVDGEQKEVIQDGRDGTSADDAVGDGAGRPVVTTRRCRQDRVVAAAPADWTQITSTSGTSAFSTWPTPGTSAPPPRAITTASNDGPASASSRPMVAGPSQVSMSRLSLTSPGTAAAPARSSTLSWSPARCQRRLTLAQALRGSSAPYPLRARDAWTARLWIIAWPSSASTVKSSTDVARVIVVLHRPVPGSHSRTDADCSPEHARRWHLLAFYIPTPRSRSAHD
jgi:hypothetical protein